MDGAAPAAERAARRRSRGQQAAASGASGAGPAAKGAASGRVGVFCCQDCGEAFREETAYLEHRQQHLQGNGQLGDQLDGLHDAEKDRGSAHFCTLCSLSFAEVSEFLAHMQTNHSQTSKKVSAIQINSGITKQQTYECQDCGKCYGVIGHYLNHQRSHRQASKSLFHDLEHLKKKSFQCESCGRNYSRASALDAHRRCHEEKLIKSRNRSSGDSFNTEESVTEAKPPETQAGDASEKSFKCSCGKAFSALLRLKTHQRFSRNSQCSPEEMKEKPKKNCIEFYCDECKKSFNGHIALFNHQRWHENHSNDSAKRFPCEECGKVFMTLTFYYRHQRMAHSDETPAKSFLHQVCQLQKKAFECKDCGLKFSRASALHSHQLHHTDVFKETEKEVQVPASLLPQQKSSEGERNETVQFTEMVESEREFPPGMPEEDSQVNETDEDLESYEPGDFNVQVISASESEDESTHVNPDLELLCESDQESRDDGDTEVSHSSLVTKPEMDLKIVQIDFEQADEQCAQIAREADNKTTGERFDCPECYRWFSSASSLRVHRMWHGVHKRRRQNQAKELNIVCKDCGLTFTHWQVFKTHLHQHAMEEEEEDDTQIGDNRNAAGLFPGREDGEEDMGDAADWRDASSTLHTNPSDAIESVSMKNKFQKGYTCFFCGKVYTYMVSFQKHLEMHKNDFPRREIQNAENLHKYECPVCDMTFIRRMLLLCHMRVHTTRGRQKSKPPRCDQCNKDFNSMKSWMSHIETHKGKPFWCLSCAKGFRDAVSLDKHLQSHSLKQHKCNICHKSFQISAQLTSHYNTHIGAKPYQCSFNGTTFRHAGNLITHKKQHLGVSVGSSEKLLRNESCGIFSEREMIEKKHAFASVQEEPETDANMEELREKKISAARDETQQEDAALGDYTNSEDSDCGEPVRHWTGKSGSDPPDELTSARPEAGQDLDKSEPRDINTYKEHKYWEWECFECDMGFDDVAKLHLHYIQHATGEVPFLQDDSEG